MRQMAEERLSGMLVSREMEGEAAAGRQRMSTKPALRVAALALQPTAARRRMIQGWLAAGGVDPDAVDFRVVDSVDSLIMRSRGTGRCGVTGRLEVVRRYDFLQLMPLAERSGARGKGHQSQKVVLRVPGKTRVPALGLQVAVRTGTRIIRERGMRAGALPARASLSAARVGRKQLVVRTWRPGDRIRPLGLNGRVKLQDLFVNAKIPIEERDRIPVLACGREIIWIPGYRVAQGWEVGGADEAILEIRVSRV